MSEVNNIPKHWQIKKLGEIAKVKGGKRLPKGDSYSEKITDFPYLRVTDFENQSIHTEKLKYLKESTQKAIKNYTISKEDVYISIAGTIGLTGTIPNSLNGANLTENAAKITELKDCYNKYVSFFLSSILGQSQIKEYTKTTTQPKLSLYRIEEIQIPLPPLPEQQLIVSRIEELLSDLENGKQQLQTAQQQLKVYRQSLLKAAFEGKLTNKEVKEGELPKGWSIKYLGEVLIKIEAGKSFKCDERTPNLNETGVLKVSSVTWQVFDENESKTVIEKERINKSYLVKKDDFLFSRANTLDLIGAVVIVSNIQRQLMLSDKTLRFKFNSDILKPYILYFLRSRKGRKEIQRLSTGNQESMRNIGQERIKQIEFPYCSLEEQLLIVSELESKLTVCDKIEETISHSLQQAETLRQSILKKAFEGKLVTI